MQLQGTSRPRLTIVLRTLMALSRTTGQAQLCPELATPLISDKHAALMHHVVSYIDTSPRGSAFVTFSISQQTSLCWHESQVTLDCLLDRGKKAGIVLRCCRRN